MNDCMDAKRAIAESAHMSRPSATHHPAVLKDAGLVSVSKKGTKNYYYMDANPALREELASLFFRDLGDRKACGRGGLSFRRGRVQKGEMKK